MSTEVESAKKWIANLLQNDVTMTSKIAAQRIFVDQAYRDLGFPYVVINYLSGDDKQGVGIIREMTIANFIVRVVTDVANLDDARAAEGRMDALLQNAVKLPSGDFFFSSRRSQPYSRSDYDEVKRVRLQNLGGIYKVWITVG